MVLYKDGLNEAPNIYEINVSTYSNPYHGELTAVKHALQECMNLENQNFETFHVLSDCQSVITAITNNKLAESHQEQINEINMAAKNLLNKRIKTKLSWIGGHTDIKGNDLADTAAKNGAMKVDCSNVTKTTLKHAKRIILDSAIEHWQKKWSFSTTGAHLKAIQPNVSIGNSSKCLSSRRAQISLHQIKIGRSELNAQDPINKKLIEEKLCITCNEIEDTEHYILHCVRYSKQRYEMFMKIESVMQSENCQTKDLRESLSFLAENKKISKGAREETLHAIEVFLKETKRLF